MSKNFLTYDEHKALNEIVFENRNKQYGAYVLRAEANQTLQKAFFVSMTFFAVLAATPLLIAKLSKTPESKTGEITHIITVIPDEPEVPHVQKVTPTVVKPETVKTQNLTVPEPKKDNLVTKEEIINPKVTDAVISTTTSPGKSVDNPNAYIDTTPKTDTHVDTTPKVDPNAILPVVDVEADFSGGINAFRNKVSENFDVSAVNSDSGEIIKGTVTFIVEKDGTISNIKVNGANADFNKEAEKTIKKIKGQWNPAKFQGQKVRSYFRLPISMQFE